MDAERPPDQQGRDAKRMLDMNEALMIASVQQHELAAKAQNAEVALRRSQALLQRQLADTELLRGLATAMIRTGTIESDYGRVLDVATALMRSQFASIQMLHADRGDAGELKLLAARGFSPESVKSWEWVGTDSQTSCGLALRARERVIVRDVQSEELMNGGPDLDAYIQAGIRAVQSTPLMTRGGELVGMISTHWSRPHKPSERSLHLFDILARQAADLIERERAGRELRYHHAQLVAFMETASVGLHRIGPDGVILWSNQADRDLLGYRSDEYVGHRIAEFHADRDVIADILARLARGEKVQGREARLLHKDGTIRHVLIDSSALWDDGRLAHTQCFTVDITALKHVEDRLRGTEAEARRLLALNQSTTTSMGEGMYSINAQGLLTTMNPEAERLLGWKSEELVGRNMHEAVHHSRRDGSPFPEEECAALGVLREGVGLRDFEDNFVDKEGKIFPVSYSASPLRDGDGAVAGVVVVFQDISERTRVRQELTRAAEELVDLNRRKDEFLAMLSHELRNPLAPICTAVQLLKTQGPGREDPVQRQAREIIERQVGNLTKIVNDLLEVSRVVSGRIRLDLQAVELNSVVQHAVETAQPYIEQRRHTLSLHRSAKVVWVNADVTRLEEILVNLLNNAAKYTPDGGRIDVYCEHSAESESALLRVRDTGVGIEEELLRNGRVFDLFTQADRSLARSAGGLGIGLSLAQRLVALHGGSIEVRSPPEGAVTGSEFIVRLPLVPPPVRTVPLEPKVTVADPEGLRILVVDDNVDMVMMLTAALRQEKYCVLSAYTGIDGLEAAQQWRPDVVLLDIGLPGLDGYDVAKRLRAKSSLGAGGKAMRLIAMTGYGRGTDIAQAREAGFDAHLTKPVDFHELTSLLVVSPGQTGGPGTRRPEP